MQSNQATQQGETKFMVGDKVKFKAEHKVEFDHKQGVIYTVEFQSETRIALVESNYVAYPDNLELVSRPIKHKHYDLIIEWAKDPVNVIVQIKDPTGLWRDTPRNLPTWRPETEYRIKPKTKEVTRWKWAFLTGGDQIMESSAYYTEEEALQQFKNATPFKLEHTAITEIEEV